MELVYMNPPRINGHGFGYKNYITDHEMKV